MYTCFLMDVTLPYVCVVLCIYIYISILPGSYESFQNPPALPQPNNKHVLNIYGKDPQLNQKQTTNEKLIKNSNSKRTTYKLKSTHNQKRNAHK